MVSNDSISLTKPAWMHFTVRQKLACYFLIISWSSSFFLFSFNVTLSGVKNPHVQTERVCVLQKEKQ